MDKTSKHIGFLDHMRGVAILAVFFFHCLGATFGEPQLAWGGHWFRNFSTSNAFLVLLPASLGWAGVAIFFVVSGFCIHLSFLRGGNNWRNFFIRRFFRIYPAYLITLMFFALVFPRTRLAFHYVLHDCCQLGSHVMLLHNFSAKYLFGINPSFWSIAVEIQLYLIYPLLLALVGRIGWNRSLMVVGLVEVMMRSSSGIMAVTSGIEFHAWFDYSPFFFWYSWAIGAALADAYMHGRNLPFARSSATVWLLLAIVSYLIKPLAPFSFLLFSVFTASVIAKFLNGWRPALPVPRAVVSHLQLLGVCSYSFYLLHQPLLFCGPVGAS